MQRQNIFTGVKMLSNRNFDNNLSKDYNRNQENELISIKENTVIVKRNQNLNMFNFDSCLDKYSGQQEIYDNFGLSMVEDFINGHDCTLILCGQNTKRYPFTDIVLGKESQQTKGLIPRMIEQIRNSIRYFSERKFLIKVSFLQVNSQEMIDLLAVKKCKLQIKQQKANKSEFYVNNLQIKPIQKVDDLESFYLIANRKRDYAYSKDYRKRENSTGFFTVHLESVEESENIYKQSKFTICELASIMFEQSGNVMDKKLEITLQNKLLESNHIKRISFASKINLSNYAFQNVINTLVYGDQHLIVPYKDSKVTKLLKSALGGTHKTSMLGTIDPLNKASLLKTLKMLKILQIAAQIQNSPTSLKHIEEKQTNNMNITIFDILQQIQKLSNELENTKINLRFLENNKDYVAQEVQRIHEKNGHQLIEENEFCSQKNLEDHVLQQKTRKQSEHKQSIKNIEKQLKQKISYIQNLSHKESQNNAGEFNLTQYETVISKRKEILMRIKSIKEKRLSSMSSMEMSQTDREKKREMFALEIEFHKEKNLYLQTIRQLQESLSLYKKLAENSLKPEEIEIIRTNSKFDESTREYDLPLFMVKNRKVKTGNLVSRSISERKFLVSPRSLSFNSIHSNSDNEKSFKPLQMKRKTINNPNNQKTQDNEQCRSEYQIDMKISTNIKKKLMDNRNRSPSNPVIQNKKQTLMKRIHNNEDIKKVVSDYEIGGIDVDRVNKYNQQRKIRKSKERNEILKKISAPKSSSNLMRRQKLRTEPPVLYRQKERKEVLSPQQDYFPRNPRQQTKKKQERMIQKSIKFFEQL